MKNEKGKKREEVFQMLKSRIAITFQVLFLILAFTALSFAATGALKITSFPSGAEVIVDGVSTGKITPMSISLSEGEHAVTVQIPGTGWSPDNRTVTVVPGNNDLSVTLLPMLMEGPAGPQGDTGPQGPIGPIGLIGLTGPQG